ncbi:polarity establishment/cellular polarization [Seiridium cupressi]
MLMRWASSAVFLLYTKLAISAPLDYFPINSQLPPVARMSKPFSFVFSPLTFYSPYTISYSLVNPPGWLSIDSDTRRLFGTPTEQDIAPGEVVGIPISIKAEDEQGTTVVNSTLVVSRNPPPKVTVPLSDQISKFGSFSAPSSIILDPSRDFSFSFDDSTFSQPGLNYYAASDDNSPLPSWITFDATGMSFSGRTPSFESLLQPPQRFGIQLVASDIVGFSSVSAPFSIVVGNHELTADTPVILLNATRGLLFEYSDLPNILKLDNQTLDKSNVNSITTTTLPQWLQFDIGAWKFSGTPGAGAESTNITVSIADTYSDELNITMALQFDAGIFRAELPALNVLSGSDLIFDLEPYLWNPSDTELEVEDQSQASWVRFDSSKLELLGRIPDTASTLQVEIVLEAASKSSQAMESRRLSIRISSSELTTSTFSSPGTTDKPTLISSSTPTALATPQPAGTELSKTKILLGVLVPLIVICIVALFVLLRCFRRRLRSREDEHVPEVSAPIPGSFIKHDASSLEGGALHSLFDIGLDVTKNTAHSDSVAATASSRLRTSSNTSRGSGAVPQALNFHAFEYRRSLSDSAVRETRESWLAGQASQRHTSPRTEMTDETSMLSATSLETGDNRIYGATPAMVISVVRPQSFRNSLVTSPVPGLSVPTVHEPFSIQATPEFAYIAESNGSDDGTHPNSPIYPESTCSGINGLGIQRADTSTSQTTSTRVSKAWRRASPSRLLEEYNKRESNPSISTIRSTRTSVSTEEAFESPMQSHVVSRPTVIHVPSRLGEVRQVSRRNDGSGPLFGGGSTVRPPKNYASVASPSPKLPRDEVAKFPPSVSSDTTGPRDGETWDKIAQSSLGITHKDIIRYDHDSISSMATIRGSLSSKTQSSHRSNEKETDVLDWTSRESNELMSPDQWPKPNSTLNPPRMIIPAKEASQSLVVSPIMTPVTPKKNRKINIERRSQDFNASPSKATPSTSAIERKQEKSRDDRLRISRIREQRALDDFKLMISKPSPVWPHPSPKPLPEPLVQSGRAPLADIANASTSGTGLGNWSNVSRKSNKSIKTTMSEFGETDDGWEDIRPESTPGAGGLSGSSTGSLPAFI